MASIDLEYKVSSFSGIGGSVDLVIHRQNGRTLDIFIETRSPVIMITMAQLFMLTLTLP